MAITAMNFPDEMAAIAWFGKQSQDVLGVIAARIALRVLPLIVDANRIMPPETTAAVFVLPLFRAGAIAWCGARYPSHRLNTQSTTAANAASIARGYVHTAAASNSASAAEHAARAVGPDEEAAAERGVTRAAAPLYFTEMSLLAAIRGAAAFVSTVTPARAELLAAVASDASTIEAIAGRDSRGAVAIALTSRPLWPGEIPRWVISAWAELKAVLSQTEQDWEVWTEWYEDRLAGRASTDPAVDIARAMLDEELWEKGPEAVNATIRQLLDKTSPEAIPAQGAGPHFTIGPASKIILAPAAELDLRGNNVQRIRQLLPLLQRSVDDLLGNLNRNAFPELFRDANQYRDAISKEEEKIAWGAVFGLGVIMENAADAAQRQIPDRILPSLEDAAQAALETVLTLHGPLILATAEGRELMEQADRLRLTREEQATLRADAQTLAFNLQKEPTLIESRAANTIAGAVELIGNGPHAERGTVFGLVTVRHVATILVPAGVLAAFGALIGSLAGPVGSVVGGAVGGAGSLVLKENERVRRAARALSSQYDQLLDAAMGQAVLARDQALSRLRALTPFRDFVRTNEEPLRRIAANSRQLRWMRGYIDFAIQPYKDKGDELCNFPSSDGRDTTSGVAKPGDLVDVMGNGKSIGPGRIVDASGDPISVIIAKPNGDPYVFSASRSFFRAVAPGAWQIDVPGPVLRQLLSD